MHSKRCRVCKTEKPIICFTWRGKAYDGTCKKCRNREKKVSRLMNELAGRILVTEDEEE